MGNNYYIDGEVYNIENENIHHIGKFTVNKKFGKTFIYYISREYQLSKLRENQTVIDEFGQKKLCSEFINEIEHLPYIENNFEFN
jgi:hypothetical protein